MIDSRMGTGIYEMNLEHLVVLPKTMSALIAQYRKWARVILKWRNSTNATSVRWSRSTSTSDIMYSGYDTMKTALCLCDLPSQNL